MLLVVPAPVGVKQPRNSLHTAEWLCQLGFAMFCTSAPADPGAHAGLCPGHAAAGSAEPGSFCPLAVCAAGRARGCSLRCEGSRLHGAGPARRGSPRALRGTRCAHAVPGTEGLCRSRGCHQRLWGQRRCGSQLFSAMLPARLASHRALPGARGCRLGTITPLRCQISHPQGRALLGCSDVPKLALSSQSSDSQSQAPAPHPWREQTQGLQQLLLSWFPCLAPLWVCFSGRFHCATAWISLSSLTILPANLRADDCGAREEMGRPVSQMKY